MKYRRASRYPVLAVVLIIVMGFVAAACSTSDDDGSSGSSDPVDVGDVPGITDDEIRFAALGTGTAFNPTGGCYLECLVEGVEAYFAYKNDDGGVAGRDLVLSEIIDDELGGNQQKALEITSANDVFGVFTTPIIPSGFGDLEQAGIPVYTYLTTVEEAQRNNVFGAPFGTNCPGCIRTDQAYVIKELGVSRVGALGYSVASSTDCANAVGQTVSAYSEDIGGAEVVYTNAGLPFGLPNGVAPEVTAMKEADVEIVFTCMDVNGVKAIAEELKKQDMGDTVVVQNSSFDSSFISDNADAYENAVIIATQRPDGPGAEGTDLELYKEWMDETGGTVGPELSLFGWYLAHLATAGIEAAGEDLTRASVIDATNGLQGFTSNGLSAERDIANQHLVPDPDDVATLQSQPYCWVVYQVNGGEGTLFGQATDETPWVCWPAPGQPWAEPEPTDFR